MIIEKRSGGRIGNTASRLILRERPLKRAHQHLALRAVVEYDAEAAVIVAVCLKEHVALLGDIGLLATNNKEAAFLDFRLPLEWAGAPSALIKFA
jgi:hypothetical protein